MNEGLFINDYDYYVEPIGGDEYFIFRVRNNNVDGLHFYHNKYSWEKIGKTIFYTTQGCYGPMSRNRVMLILKLGLV